MGRDDCLRACCVAWIRLSIILPMLCQVEASLQERVSAEGGPNAGKRLRGPKQPAGSRSKRCWVTPEVLVVKVPHVVLIVRVRVTPWLAAGAAAAAAAALIPGCLRAKRQRYLVPRPAADPTPLFARSLYLGKKRGEREQSARCSHRTRLHLALRTQAARLHGLCHA